MRKLLVLFLAAWCGLCFADDGADRRAAASQLVELMGVAESIVRPAANCLPKDVELAAQARSWYEQHPDKFEGMTPQSAYWPDFEQVYRRYSVESCLFLLPELIAATYARALAEKIQLPELQAAIQFYSTPEGQRFAKGAMLVSEKFCADLKEAEAGVLAHAQTNYRTGMQKLIARYKANPK